MQSAGCSWLLGVQCKPAKWRRCAMGSRLAVWDAIVRLVALPSTPSVPAWASCWPGQLYLRLEPALPAAASAGDGRPQRAQVLPLPAHLLWGDDRLRKPGWGWAGVGPAGECASRGSSLRLLLRGTQQLPRSSCRRLRHQSPALNPARADCPYEWFHFGCVGLTEENRPKGKWYCRDCRKVLGKK